MAIRQKAEKALGNRFDIRAFHDQVLKDGPMPLAIFETKMNSWIKSQQAIAGKTNPRYYIRVNDPLSNLNAFYAAYGNKKGNHLWRPLRAGSNLVSWLDLNSW